MKKRAYTFLFCFITLLSFSQDTTYLKVHFLYGSKPLYKYRESEPVWFGGILGGHVGIEADSGKIIDFSPSGKFHVFENDYFRRGRFTVKTRERFYSTLGGDPDSAKKAIVYIPVSKGQRDQFDSVTTCYLRQTPYDYAFIGMRCSAAAYDVLGKLGIVNPYSRRETYRRIFYPRLLRKRLLKKAVDNKWTVERHPGCSKRKWEKDRNL